MAIWRFWVDYIIRSWFGDVENGEMWLGLWDGAIKGGDDGGCWLLVMMILGLIRRVPFFPSYHNSWSKLSIEQSLDSHLDSGCDVSSNTRAVNESRMTILAILATTTTQIFPP